MSFIGSDIFGTIAAILASLGSDGLVGLAFVAVIFALITCH